MSAPNGTPIPTDRGTAVEQILLELIERLAFAKDLVDVNIAAGLAAAALRPVPPI
jgi:hypothetical protein